MKYSIEEIFLKAGQFDEIVNVSFKHDSESNKLYGKHITGEFIYTPAEREILQEVTNKKNFALTYGYLKFNELVGDLPNDKKKLLKRNGFNAYDISHIIGPNRNLINNYSDKETRHLPKPIEINVDFSDIDQDDLTINTYSQMLSSGHILIADERDKYNAAILKKFGNNIPKNEYNEIFVDASTGEIKKGIRYHYLERKNYSKEGLSTEEGIEYKEILDSILKERVSIAFEELKKSHENYIDIFIQYPKTINIITTLVANFKVERLLIGHFPIWWDFERFIHIYLRHVEEIQLGDRFITKTPFQYSLKDVKSLIVFVLRQIQKEIQEHFRKNPGKDFKRQGSMSIYYNGDFYTLHIAKDGRLMTFYKSSKKGLINNGNDNEFL